MLDPDAVRSDKNACLPMEKILELPELKVKIESTLISEMPLFRKFPEIRKFIVYFRKNVTILSVMAMTNNAHNFEVQELITC